MDEYPQLDNAMMSAMVDEYEEKESKPSLDEMEVPLPPEKEAGFELPAFDDEGSLLLEVPSQEKKITEPSLPVELPIEKGDVEDLALLENVFDKRITEEDMQREMAVETRNDSGRLLDKEDVEVKTELNDKEIVSISKLRFIAERYDVPVLNDFTDNLMTLKISRKRKGRTEFIQGLHADERREQPNESFFSRFFGGNK